MKKIIYDPKIKRSYLNDILTNISSNLDLKKDTIYSIITLLESGYKKGMPINEIYAYSLEELINTLIDKYINRGKAIMYSKLRMVHDDDIKMIHLNKLRYGSHISNYTLTEKYFLGKPNKCHILFGYANETQKYNIDNLLKEFSRKNI